MCSHLVFIALANAVLVWCVALFVCRAKGIQLDSENGRFVNTDALYPMLTLNYFGQVGSIAFL